MLRILAINRTRFVAAGVVGILSFIAFACTSSKLTNLWKDPEYTSPPMTNMLIIAAKRNSVNRRLWEDLIVAEMRDAGVKAKASYSAFPDSIPTPDEVGGAVRQEKYDGVLFIRRLPPEFSTTYIQGDVRSVPVTQYDRRSKTYITFYREVQDPGYTDTSRTERQEISVFATDKEGGRLIWSGTGELINPSSREDVRHEISALITPELIDQGIIPPKKQSGY